MAIIESVFGRDIWPAVAKVILLACLIPATVWIYTIFFHPLAKFPGPLAWRASRIPYLRAVWGGHFPYVVQRLHEQYGDVVRVAPNELSFSNSAAWDDIYANRAGENAHGFPKSEIWHGNPSGAPASVHFIIDDKEHARVRRFLSPAFSEKAVLLQEPILQDYATLLIDKMFERLDATKGKATINMVDWLQFTLFDMIGDLAFGESFGCLEKCEYEDWMSQSNASTRVMYFTIQLRHYPAKVKAILGSLLGLSIPPDIIEKRKQYRERTVAKLDRRLAAGGPGERQDIVAQLMKSDNRKEGLSKDEVMLNSILFISAASETTTTTLVGALNNLMQHPESLLELEREVRAFPTSAELTLSTLKQLPYLDGVLREALRMCNPNPIGHMRASPPEGGFVAGHFVPANTLVTVQPVAMAYSEEHFHQASEWHPERWLGDAKSNPQSPFYNDNRKVARPFGFGSYNCIGEPLGWAQMRLILAKMVWAFDLTKADSPNSKIVWDKQEVYATVLKEPLDVSFSRRKL